MILVGSLGNQADSDGTIRIGDGLYPDNILYIPAIVGNSISSGGSPMVVNPDGMVGVEPPSSRRYKEEIHDMGEASSRGRHQQAPPFFGRFDFLDWSWILSVSGWGRLNAHSCPQFIEWRAGLPLEKFGGDACCTVPTAGP
jgi:hypothetical protein